MNEELRSEFGRGLVTCLVKFAEHTERFKRTSFKDMPESMGVECHMNAASDHLYEIEYPPEWETTYPHICEMIKHLQNAGLDLRYGEEGTWEDVDSLYKLARAIALEIDKILGLDPDMGTW